MRLDKEEINGISSKFGYDFLSIIAEYPLGNLAKADYECIIVELLSNSGKIGTSSRDMAVSLQTTPTIVKNLRLRYHAKYGTDNCIENVRKMFKKIFNREDTSKEDKKNANNEEKQTTIKPKIYYDKEKIIFAVDNPIEREDFRSYIESKGFYTDTSFNNNIITINHAVFIDILQENGKEIFGVEIINKKFEEEIKEKLINTEEFKKIDLDKIIEEGSQWSSKVKKLGTKALGVFWKATITIISELSIEMLKKTVNMQ